MVEEKNITKNEFPMLSDDERQRRWNEIRWRMDHAGLDCLLVWGNESKWQSALANVRYITGRASPGMVLMPLEGDPILWSGFPHDVTKWGAMAGGWIVDIRSGQSKTENICESLREHHYTKSRIGVVGFGETRPRVIPETVPFQQYSKIRASLEDAQFIDAGWLVEQTRLIKSDEELALLWKSADLTKAMADAIFEAAQPNVREFEVYAHMLHACLVNGGEEDMIWISSGANPPPHAKRSPASKRKLKKGDTIVTEYHACYEGYLTGAEISLSIGNPSSDKYREIYKSCTESQRSGIAAMQPGNYLKDAIQGFREPIMNANLASVECGLHGHGLASPEFPSCMYGGDSGSWHDHPYARIPKIKFQENMVFATASDLFDPKWKHDTGLMLGRTVLITKEGPKEMTGLSLSQDLPVV